MTDAGPVDRGDAAGAAAPETAVGRVTGETTVPVESATTMLLRDGDASGGTDALEVFMLERHIESDFAGGAYVFPGGKVDDRDCDLDPLRWTGIDLPVVARLMRADEALTLGWYVAAVREAFEEAGFLLAHRRGGATVTAEDLDRPSFASARARLADRDTDWDWSAWLADEDLVLDLGALAWWSWWVTPHGLHDRYETRFFVANVPRDQVGVHDEVETVASRWTRPADALAAAREDRVTIIYPTRKNLETLARYRSASEVLAAARAGEVDRRRTRPEIVEVDGGIGIRHPFTGEVDEP